MQKTGREVSEAVVKLFRQYIAMTDELASKGWQVWRKEEKEIPRVEAMVCRKIEHEEKYEWYCSISTDRDDESKAHMVRVEDQLEIQSPASLDELWAVVQQFLRPLVLLEKNRS